MKYASIGSISHGTLRNEDSIPTLSSELEDCVNRNAKEWCNDDGRKQRDIFLKLIGAADWIAADSENADEYIIELMDALDTFAPPYCYFGANEGDGSDFGFWPSMDSIHELPRVEDSDGAMALGEDCVFVNDHGNVTVYGGDGSVIWDCV